LDLGCDTKGTAQRAVAEHGAERVLAWIEYAQRQDGLRNEVGYVLKHLADAPPLDPAAGCRKREQENEARQEAERQAEEVQRQAAHAKHEEELRKSAEHGKRILTRLKAADVMSIVSPPWRGKRCCLPYGDCGIDELNVCRKIAMGWCFLNRAGRCIDLTDTAGPKWAAIVGKLQAAGLVPRAGETLEQFYRRTGKSEAPDDDASERRVKARVAKILARSPDMSVSEAREQAKAVVG